jgi:phenylacetate-CoA ligase
VLTRDKGLDRMEVLVEVTPEVFGDQIGALENLHDKLICALDRTLGLRVAIRLVRPQTILRSEGKAQRVVDRRKLE